MENKNKALSPMNTLLLSIRNRFFNKQLDFRVRLFNVLAMGGTVISLAMALVGIGTGYGTRLAHRSSGNNQLHKKYDGGEKDNYGTFAVFYFARY